MTLNEPKDLGVKIGSKAERFWTEVKAHTGKALEDAQNSVLLQGEVLKIAERNIKIEHDKFRKKP